MILAFLKSYLTQIALGLIILGASAWGFKIWLNKHDVKVVKETEIRVMERERKANQVQWDLQMKTIEEERKILLQRLDKIPEMQIALDQMKKNNLILVTKADSVYQQTVDLIAKEKEKTSEIINSIPSAALPAAIIEQSRKLPLPR